MTLLAEPPALASSETEEGPIPFVFSPAQVRQMEEWGWTDLGAGGWTKPRLRRMDKAGWFEDRRVELMEGEIYRMSRISNQHIVGVVLTGRALRPMFGDGYTIVEQSSFDGGRRSQPQPDVAVYGLNPREIVRIPRTALLIVEVAKSTLAYDRGPKMRLYARAGIADYWILNLRHRVLEVHRRLTVDPDGAARYAEVVTVGKDEAIAPLAAPDSPVLVTDLLP